MGSIIYFAIGGKERAVNVWVDEDAEDLADAIEEGKPVLRCRQRGADVPVYVRAAAVAYVVPLPNE